MACIKCGRDTESNQYFCKSCSEIMQQYPVKPNIAVHLPKRPEAAPQPKRWRRRLFPEETIEHLRSAVRWATAVIVVLLLLLSSVSALLAWEWMQPGSTVQNFEFPFSIVSDETP